MNLQHPVSILSPRHKFLCSITDVTELCASSMKPEIMTDLKAGWKSEVHVQSQGQIGSLEETF